VLKISSAPERPFASGQADRPIGHSVDNFHREDGFGLVTTVVHPPVKGACRLPTPPIPPQPGRFNTLGSSLGGHSQNVGGGGTGRLPKLNFPPFDGDNPKLWLSRSVDFLEMYEVEPHKWIKIATMHFIEPAARWLPSVELKLHSCSWATFESLVLERFGRDQHALLARQLFHIRQTGTVEDYVVKFAGLVDELTAYESRPDPLHYTMQFIDGLRDDIRAVVLIQHPTELDTTYVLAKLQDEVSMPPRKREFRRADYTYQQKYEVPAPSSFPGYSKLDKVVAQADDVKGADLPRFKSAEDKWAAVKAFCRARGLCHRCVEKWFKDHRCAEKVQLHVLQEMMEVFQCEESPLEEQDSASQDQLFLTVSQAAVTGSIAPRTMCM
jgi:hypothetical protein